MKHVVKVSFYLKKNETKEEGKCPVMAQLTVGRLSKVSFSTKMTALLSLWGSGRAIGKSQTANEINRKLDEIRTSALSHYRELSAVREHVTAEEVIRNDTRRAVFLQSTAADFQQAGQLTVREKPLSAKDVAGSGFQLVQQFPRFLQPSEKMGYTRVLFVD